MPKQDTLKPFTDKDREDYRKRIEELEEDFRPLLEDLRDSTLITAEDLRIRINARDDEFDGRIFLGG